MDISLVNLLKLRDKGIISIIGAGGKTSLMFCLAKELSESGKRVLTTTTTKIFMPGPDQSPLVITADSLEELVYKSKAHLTRYNHFSAGNRQISTLKKLKGFDPHIIDQLWETACFDWIIVEADGAKQKPLKASDIHEPLVPEMTTCLIHVTGLDALGRTLDNNNIHRAELFSKNTGLLMGEKIDEQSIAISAALEIKKAGTTVSAPFLKFIFLNKADNLERIKKGKNIAELIKIRNIADAVIIASLKEKKSIQYRVDTKNKETK